MPTPTMRAALQQHKPDHTLSISQDTLSLQAAIKYRIESSVVLVVLQLALVIPHNTEVALQVAILKSMKITPNALTWRCGRYGQRVGARRSGYKSGTRAGSGTGHRIGA
jgi:hypothetical protein